MNPNAIIVKMKSLESLLNKHLIKNGHHRDSYTDMIDSQYMQCARQLCATHWTQETDELRAKWNQTPEMIDSIRKNQKIIK